jgi:hypothetical protein
MYVNNFFLTFIYHSGGMNSEEVPGEIPPEFYERLRRRISNFKEISKQGGI